MIDPENRKEEILVNIRELATIKDMSAKINSQRFNSAKFSSTIKSPCISMPTSSRSKENSTQLESIESSSSDSSAELKFDDKIRSSTQKTKDEERDKSLNQEQQVPR